MAVVCLKTVCRRWTKETGKPRNSSKKIAGSLAENGLQRLMTHSPDTATPNLLACLLKEMHRFRQILAK